MSEDYENDAEDASEAENGYQPERIELSFEETRVLGCLLEKEMTTPDNYPLSENQLMSACNQTSSREPVVSFDMDTIREAMEDLRLKKLSILIRQAGARVAKFKHTTEMRFVYLDKPELALLSVLLLRGQQTLGELRTRTERAHHFADLDRTQASLDKLLNYEPFPLAKRVPAGGGRRVETFVHLLSGDAIPETSVAQAPAETVASSSPSWRSEMQAEIDGLKNEVATLREEMAALKTELGA